MSPRDVFINTCPFAFDNRSELIIPYFLELVNMDGNSIDCKKSFSIVTRLKLLGTNTSGDDSDRYVHIETT